MSGPDDIERGRLANGVLENPIFEEAFGVLKEGYVQGMLKCGPGDDIGRHRYTFALRDLETVKAHLRAVLQAGEIKQQEIEAFKERESVFKRATRNFY